MRKLYVLLLSLLLTALATPSHAADNGSWSVYPVSGSVAERPYFSLFADPGQTIEDKVVVVNKTAEPMTFRLYSADAYNTARDGGFAVRTMKEKMRGVGVWAKPAKSRIKVPGHGKVTVPFTLKVPDGAEPGDHPGAIVALDERIDPGKAPSRSVCSGPSPPVSTSGSAGPPCPRSPSRTSASSTTSRSYPASATARPRSPTPSTTPAISP